MISNLDCVRKLVEAAAAITPVNPHAGTTLPLDVAHRKITVLSAERHAELATLVKITALIATQVTRTNATNRMSKDTIAKKCVVTVHRKWKSFIPIFFKHI